MMESGIRFRRLFVNGEKRVGNLDQLRAGWVVIGKFVDRQEPITQEFDKAICFCLIIENDPVQIKQVGPVQGRIVGGALNERRESGRVAINDERVLANRVDGLNGDWVPFHFISANSSLT